MTMRDTKWRSNMIAKIKFLSFLTYLAIAPLHIYSQTVEIENIAIRDGKVSIKYNLLDSIQGRHYTVRLYSSRDEFLNPLNELSGDHGMEILPGSRKTIEWNARQELGSGFNGDVALELRARVYIPFINVDDFDDIKTLTRHRKYSLTWSGGRPSNILNFNLYRDDEKITTFSNIANVGHHDLEIPAHIKPGKGYYFLISDIKNKDEVVKTNEFKVRRKIPLALKVLPVFLIGGAFSTVDSGGGLSDSTLPDPVLPSEN